ncbi:MAG: C10 family peptidase [Candidatus Eisenbacteria bacterium]
MRRILVLAMLVVFCLLFIAAPLAWAERATQAEMSQVCENWLTYIVAQKGSWAGNTQPRIVNVQDIVVDGVVLARCYSISPLGNIVVPVLKELPPVMSWSDDCDLDVTQNVGFPQLLRDVFSEKARVWTEAYGSLDAPLPRTGAVLFGDEGRVAWDHYTVTGRKFVAQIGEGPVAPLAQAGPLLTDSWHQGFPYDNSCPVGFGGDRCVVGCVATAASQIMHYWEYPPSGTGSHEYDWDGDQGDDPANGCPTHDCCAAHLSATFSDAYDWANMPDDCTGGSSAAEQAAVAELCYEVGVAFNMDYGTCGSGATTEYGTTVYPTYFGYSPSINKVNRDPGSRTPAQWLDIIKPQINAGRPMQYRISGHSIVCDGWMDTGGVLQYHINYGWGGSHTQWFSIDTIYCPWDGCGPDVEYLLRDIFPLNRPPVAVCANAIVNADAACMATATIDDGSYDPDGDTITLVQSPAGPYPLGTTSVTLTVTDEHGLSAQCTADVTVRDVTPPMGICPADVTVECKGYCGTPSDDPSLAAFFAGFSATDNCDAALDMTDNRPTCFPEGTTTVRFRATDDAANWFECGANVRVRDTTPPYIVCPADVTVECSDHCGTPSGDPQLAAFFAGVVASDLCDDTLDMTDTRPACFPEGTTNVAFTARDDADNTASCMARVTVVDTTPPEIVVALNRDVLWPPNHKMADIVTAVTVRDICDPDPGFMLISITSNEPENGLGDGDTPNDIQGADIGTPDLAFQLRSERSGGGSGRIYTITYMGFDHSGNTTVVSVYVRVPHDRSGGALASVGFTADGTCFDPAGEHFAILIPSASDGTFDAAGIDAARAYVGNLKGVLTPVDHLDLDATQDGRMDLVLWYSVADAEEMFGHSVASAENAWLHVAFDPEIPDAPVDPNDPMAPFGPVGIHYVGADGVDYLVPNIFQLGSPVVLDITVNAAGVDGQPAAGTALLPIRPNPFGQSTTVAFDLAAPGAVSLEIYDARGVLVRTLEDGVLPAGQYQSVWDGRDSGGRRVAAGVYFARLRTADTHAMQKMLLLK